MVPVITLHCTECCRLCRQSVNSYFPLRRSQFSFSYSSKWSAFLDWFIHSNRWAQQEASRRPGCSPLSIDGKVKAQGWMDNNRLLPPLIRASFWRFGCSKEFWSPTNLPPPPLWKKIKFCFNDICAYKSGAVVTNERTNDRWWWWWRLSAAKDKDNDCEVIIINNNQQSEQRRH